MNAYDKVKIDRVLRQNSKISKSKIKKSEKKKKSLALKFLSPFLFNFKLVAIFISVSIFLLILLAGVLTVNTKDKGFIERNKDRLAMASLLYTYNNKVENAFDNVKHELTQRPGSSQGLVDSNYLGAGNGNAISFPNIDPNARIVYDNVSDIKLNDLERLRAGQYAGIIEESSNKAGIPSWVLYAISYWEGGMTEIGGGLRVGTIGSMTEFENGKDYYNYIAPVNPDHGNYVGPFQLDKNMDIRKFSGEETGGNAYNYADAAMTAAFHAKGKYDTVKGYVGEGYSDAQYWLLATGANNTGQGGFLWRYPQETHPKFMELQNNFLDVNNINKMANLYYSKDRADANGGRRALFEILDSLGWRFDATARDKKWTRGINWTQPLFVDKTDTDTEQFNGGLTREYEGWWPGDSETRNRKTANSKISTNNNETGARKLSYGPATSEYMAYPGDGRVDYMMNNRVNIEYISISYAVGCVIRDTLAEVLGTEISPENTAPVYLAYREGYLEPPEDFTIYDEGKGDTVNLLNNSDLGIKIGQKKVLYNWEAEQLKEGLLFEDLKTDSRAIQKEGPYNEVGYKGTFPIFVQGTNMNSISKLPWKFQGRNTTLGTSGCSIFTLASMIHGAGYGDMEIPNYPGKLPTFKNLSEILTNGPITSNHVKNILGYNVSVLPTNKDSDFDNIWSKLLKGVPYVVNVNSKTVTAYDEYLNPKKTKFTNGGHFIILAGGYEQSGKRFVEVVQSTGSNAGLKEIDQNRVVFDFDEMIDVGVIRSSFGSAVPAYTITGGANLPNPKYLTTGYEIPTRVEQTIRESVEVETTNEDIVIDLFTVQ